MRVELKALLMVLPLVVKKADSMVEMRAGLRAEKKVELLAGMKVQMMVVR